MNALPIALPGIAPASTRAPRLTFPTRHSRLSLALGSALIALGGLAALPVSALAAAEGPGHALPAEAANSGPVTADATALTDDHSVNVPTGWWTYTGVTPAQIGAYLEQNAARLTDLEVQSLSGGTPLFTVRMVSNSGAYAVPGWWWYYGLTAESLNSLLAANSGRLIEVEPYDDGSGNIKFAVIMVSNTGNAARAWSYLLGATSADIAAHISRTGDRLIDLDNYLERDAKKYTAVFVANTGTDAKGWEWWLNMSPAAMAQKVKAFHGRIVKLDRQPDGSYNFVQVKNTGADASAWWYGFGFASLGDVNDFASQLAARPVDLTTYVDDKATRRYDAAFIDNANASTRRMRSLLGKTFLDANGAPTRGIFESYLKQVGGAVKVNLNGNRRAEPASAIKALHLLHALKQVESGADALGKPFLYYEYDVTKGKDACPDPSKEIPGNEMHDLNFGMGLAQMMSISDNRTTRGTVIRYGGFLPFNITAAVSGLGNTQIRQNAGCGYWNFDTGMFDPANRRNDTTAGDLAHIYEGVFNKTLLSNAHGANAAFMSRANPSVGLWPTHPLQLLINEEAALQGKLSIAEVFGSMVKTWGKGGSYDTCLGDGGSGCGQRVIVRSGAGLIQLPIINPDGISGYRSFVFGRLISDVPVPCWEDTTTAEVDCQPDTDYTKAYSDAATELYRDEVRNALKTWSGH